MILRRISESIRRQDWFTVLLEIVIVVIGVFIGIEVANWNEDLANQRLGADYESRLAADLENDLFLLRGMDAYYQAVLSSVVETAALLDQPEPDQETLLTTAYRATEINYNPPTQSTWNQIVSSGHIGLLPREAADLVAEYFAFDFVGDGYQLLADSDYRKRVRSLIPVQVQQAIRDGCSDQRTETGVIIGFVPECDLGLDPETLARVADTLHQDELVRSTLNFQFSDVYSTATNIQGLVVLLERTVAALGQPVGEDSAPAKP